MLNQMVADLQKSSAVQFSSWDFVRPVRIRGKFHVGALHMLPWVAENATADNLCNICTIASTFPSRTQLVPASSWRADKLLHCGPDGPATCRPARRGAEATQSCGALRQNLQLGLRLLPVVILEVLCGHGRVHVQARLHAGASQQFLNMLLVALKSRLHSCHGIVPPR